MEIIIWKYMEIYGNTCGHLSESMSISIGNCVVKMGNDGDEGSAQYS